MALLAEKLRPTINSLHLLSGPAKKIWNSELVLWRKTSKFHIVFWGAPGVGKTTLARLLAEACNSETNLLSAVNDGVKEIRNIVKNSTPDSIIIIDEIHRLSKSQQDVLLPILEESKVWIIGATTENPATALIPPLLSRLRLIKVKSPNRSELEAALVNSLQYLEKEYGDRLNETRLNQIKILIHQKIGVMSAGDLRFGLNFVEALCNSSSEEEDARLIANSMRAFSTGDHYDYISAMIKSVRGSDPDAAMYYAAKALDSGEDIIYIMRRCVILAAEDIGNSDPQALILAQAALASVREIGMPEAAIIMAQCVTYLSSTQKSNRAYMALKNVRNWIENTENLEPIKTAPQVFLTRRGHEQYKYPHDSENAFIDVEYLPASIAALRKGSGPAYVPSERGTEAKIGVRLQELWPAIWKKIHKSK